MESEHDKLLRIRKLFSKAEEARTLVEAEIHNDRAIELMARHSIESAMRIVTEPAQNEITSRKMTLDGPYSLENSALAGGIASPMNCQTVSHHGADRRRIAAITFVGCLSDLNCIEISYTSLLMQSSRSVANQTPPQRSDKSTDSFRRRWLMRFAAEIHHRLSGAGDRAAATHNASRTDGQLSAALLRANRRDWVARATSKFFPTPVAPPRPRLTDSGHTAKSNADRRSSVSFIHFNPPRRGLGPDPR